MARLAGHVFACAVSLCAALVCQGAGAVQHTHHRGDRWTGCSRGVHYRFVRYEQSEWEVDTWSPGVDACVQYATGAQKVSTWLRTIREYDDAKLEAANLPSEGALVREGQQLIAFDESVFSRMIFENICAGESSGRLVSVPIEPLVGHLRHPHAVCAGADAPKGDIMDTSYLLINAWPPSVATANFPGRKYLLDLGASTFDTSLAFFIKRYGQSGVLFDEVWAWEMAAYDQKEYWAKVPDSYMGRMHWYNTAFESDIRNASHPLNIMRSLYKPGDMFIVKLDVDNAALELSVISAIENDPMLLYMISEMYFEMHYDHSDMAPWFGLNNGRALADVKERFTALRKAGLSLHFWP